jgi:hypothetical protein
MVLGLSDAEHWANYKGAIEVINETADGVAPFLPKKALDHEEMRALPHKNESYCWDESYTIAENLLIAYDRGYGDRYKELGIRFLKDDTFFDPLSKGDNVLPFHHAYSYTNALSSAARAFYTLGSQKHFLAAKNAFDMIQSTQSYATGGWGPNETFVEPGKGRLAESLESAHHTFETPCGSYAHFKLTRYLLRATKEPRYGDSMEQIMLNTVLGAKRLQPDGKGFYYSDYTYTGEKFFHKYQWTCCTGSLPQLVCDYHVSAYFEKGNDLYVNLYLPSTLTWNTEGKQRITLKQSGDYPLDEQVKLVLGCSGPTKLALHFRIPEWCGKGASIAINGKQESPHLAAGSFARVDRWWHNGDVVELKLPMPLRLVAVDEQNPDIVALMRGPLVLFAITTNKPKVTKEQLLAAKRIASDRWQVETADAPLTLLPFTSITDEHYTTYMKVTV